ncbi:hypothetical protein Y032_0001g246 [Ancylostoma ceylanicum]|uniref:Uncharacterized protein n=1 Tax=Ancylostoma ceylanicum TaxID=53326 RepID=A0A016W3G2_9BILA|nr:hypothetical protein Y032_0001g246 [Ancylostoma ceylanicum]
MLTVICCCRDLSPSHLRTTFEIFVLKEPPVAADQNGICDSVQNCRKKNPFLITYSGGASGRSRGRSRGSF